MDVQFKYVSQEFFAEFLVTFVIHEYVFPDGRISDPNLNELCRCNYFQLGIY